VVEFESDHRTSRYEMIFTDAPPDILMFTDERIFYHDDAYPRPQEIILQVGHQESALQERAEENTTCRVIYAMLSRCRTYQFHDTSAAASVRKPSYIENARYLMSDAGNLAAYLYAMRQNSQERRYYDRIVSTIQQVYPQFKDFDIEPSRLDGKNVLLNWREKGNSEYMFGPHQLSDGTLRFMALATLFLQPPQRLPSAIVIDEPELGLHPHAITVLAGLIHGVSDKCQVVLSTQSTRLVDEFEVEQIVVVERDRKENCSRCRRPDPKALEDWIKQYSTSELWEKNVLGGRP
jgi:predicted ATPase